MKWIFGFLACLASATLVATAPAPLQNYCPVVIVNSTTLPASQIYFVAHGNDPNGLPCFLVPNGSGICQYVYPTPSGTPSSAGSSVLLSSLPTATGTTQTDPAFLIYVPINSSSRAYFSINNPMYLATAFNPKTGVLSINDSSVTTLTDPNYYTYYQDMEFGLVPGALSQTLLYLNLSFVDYFCLPMHLTSYSYPSNTELNNDKSTPAGFTPSTTQTTIFNTTTASLTSGQAKSPAPVSWSTLSLPYYLNPYTDSTASTYLRILAAKNGIDLGTSMTTFQGAKVTEQYFPPNYASTSTYGPVSGQSFMQTAYNYYNTANTGNPFNFQIFPAGISATTIYSMTAQATDPSSYTLTFTSSSVGAPSPITLSLASLTTDQLLSGSVWPFEPTNTSTAYTNEISKLISALFTIGQFPYPLATTTSPFVNNTSGYNALTYFTNPFNYQLGPWFNLYDQALHQQMVNKGSVPNNPTLGLAYAYDYDDLLSMSGIINGLEIQDQYGNPSSSVAGSTEPYVVVTLGSLSGTPIPDISTDSYTYPVVMGPAAGGVAVTFTYYNGTSTVTTPAVSTGNTTLGNVVVDSTHPFQINFTFNSIVYTYNINLMRQCVVPTSTTSTFSTTDQYFQGGVIFTVSGTQGSPQFFIQYNSVPPPWPG